MFIISRKVKCDISFLKHFGMRYDGVREMFRKVNWEMELGKCFRKQNGIFILNLYYLYDHFNMNILMFHP